MRTRRHIPCFLAVLPFLISAADPAPAISQTVPEFCASLQQFAEEQSRQFGPLPKGCRINIDKGYDLAADYIDHAVDGSRWLSLSLRVDFEFLHGDASALWIHLSAFDGLAHSVMGTKPQAVFDGMSTLIKSLARAAVKGEIREGTFFDGHADKANLMMVTDGKVVVAAAGADVKDINKMKHTRDKKAGGEVATWRRILGLSLQVFGAGAQGYANAYRGPSNPQWQSQPVYSAPRTCYTNFIGTTAFTNCY